MTTDAATPRAECQYADNEDDDKHHVLLKTFCRKLVRQGHDESLGPSSVLVQCTLLQGAALCIGSTILRGQRKLVPFTHQAQQHGAETKV